MRNQSIRLFIYSSLAIVALTLVWGIRQIPKMGAMAEDQLRNSLEQELGVVTSAVKASTSALKFRLLDVLKAEGGERSTQAFHDSPFASVSLLEWDGSQWKILSHASKLKGEFQETELNGWIKQWPLAKISYDESYFAKVNDVQGQAYFALVMPVRKASSTPMIGIGVFSAAQFGLSLPADHSRQVRVFDNKGFALALAHPAYVGANLKREPIVDEILDGDVLSVRQEWKGERGQAMVGLASRLSDSNLFAAIETNLPLTKSGQIRTWIYLLLSALGAVALNWVLFSSMIRPLFEHLAKSEVLVETLRRQLTEPQTQVSATPAVGEPAIPSAELPNVHFLESPEEDESSQPMPDQVERPVVGLGKVVGAGLRSLDSRLREANVVINKIGLDEIQLGPDVLQLQTAIEELIKNAVEAMQNSSDRQLTFEAHQFGNRVRLTIDDTGCGIPESNVKKVFDPFFSTKDSEGVARGLGLNVVRRVVEELQGTVHVRNRTSGGVSVELEWPIVKSQASDPIASTDLFDDQLDMMLSEISVKPPLNLRREVPVGIAIRKPIVRSLD